MRKLTTFIKFVSVAVSLGIAVPAYAESAPVYDVDSMPQQFDSSAADQPDLPPPPPPGQETFVPMQSNNQSSQQPVVYQGESSSPKGTVEQRMRRVEQQINNMQNSESAARLDAMQEQMQAMRGQMEQMTHDMQQMQAQQKAMYSDIDKRLSEKSVSVPVADNKGKAAKPEIAAVQQDDSPGLTPSAKSSRQSAAKAEPKAVAKSQDKSDNQPNVAEEQQIYQTAYNFIKAKKYNEAVAALQGMLKKYPSGQFAANAHYWLGELYGLMSKHDLALAEFNTVIKTYPDSPRMSDAQLKVGLIYASQSQWPDAKSSFKTVINRYPGTASARLASEQLKQIKQAGH